MSDGKLEQVDRPDRIYNEPATGFVATFVGENNTLSGDIVKTNGTFALINTSAGMLKGRNPNHYETGKTVRAYIRPEELTPIEGLPENENSFDCLVVSQSFEGAFSNVWMKTPQGERFLMRLSSRENSRDVDRGERVRIAFRPESVLLLAE